MKRFSKIISGTVLLTSLFLVPLAAHAGPNSGVKSAAEMLNAPSEGNYAVISNESVSGAAKEYTGSIPAGNSKFSVNPQLGKEAYKLDVIKPFKIPQNGEGQIDQGSYTKQQVFKVGDVKKFMTSNMENGTNEKISAKLLYSGKKSNVWVSAGKITQLEAEKLGREFDQKIHSSVTNNFGTESDVNRDGKIDILCFDIKDGFAGPGDGFIAGYFNPGDLFNQSYKPNSNESEIFYIDTYPLMETGTGRDVTAAYTTLAHEFQHMVNFNQNVIKEQSHTQMDVWLDEAFAMAAEQIYSGKVLTDRIEYYNQSDSIARGHSLLYWDEQGDVLANYSLSYLFGQYMMLQSNKGNSIFKEILADKKNDYRAVENAAKKYIHPSMTFGQLMTHFRLALLQKEASGLFGFKGVADYNQLEKRFYTGGPLDVRGGGAVVKPVAANFSVPTDKGRNIFYTMINSGKTPVLLLAPVAAQVDDNDTQVTGKTVAGATVYIKAGSKELGKGSAGSDGRFIVKIPRQKAGTVLTVYSVDKAGNKSRDARITVLDKTPPGKPSVNTVKDYDKRVTGKAEAGAKVSVQAGKAYLGYGTADQYGKFSVTLKTAQKAGTVLAIQAKDKAGNASTTNKTTVIDKTPPAKPSVSGLNTASTYVKGKAEPYSTVYVKIKGKVIAKTTLKKSTAFSVKIKKQKAGTVLYVFAKDKAGNFSPSTKVTVKKK
ncbi:Ig-like domain-containing protein [Mesobacillus zeae]|uniref:Bacterial Ig domain-containing protein n=1 Tax=Mesobacillus zeae TaxID=1917180 RepID=A0A398AVI6_9BACI|nr:Ig-like domain-containing protein [Mesobacillus zeae]RID81739.1 hypothetical protein D1970_21040 [Mesobacillus zeae]